MKRLFAVLLMFVTSGVMAGVCPDVPATLDENGVVTLTGSELHKWNSEVVEKAINQTSFYDSVTDTRFTMKFFIDELPKSEKIQDVMVERNRKVWAPQRFRKAKTELLKAFREADYCISLAKIKEACDAGLAGLGQSLLIAENEQEIVSTGGGVLKRLSNENYEKGKLGVENYCKNLISVLVNVNNENASIYESWQGVDAKPRDVCRGLREQFATGKDVVCGGICHTYANDTVHLYWRNLKGDLQHKKIENMNDFCDKRHKPLKESYPIWYYIDDKAGLVDVSKDVVTFKDATSYAENKIERGDFIEEYHGIYETDLCQAVAKDRRISGSYICGGLCNNKYGRNDELEIFYLDNGRLDSQKVTVGAISKGCLLSKYYWWARNEKNVEITEIKNVEDWDDNKKINCLKYSVCK